MPSPFACSSVICDGSWKKTHIEKKKNRVTYKAVAELYPTMYSRLPCKETYYVIIPTKIRNHDSVVDHCVFSLTIDKDQWFVTLKNTKIIQYKSNNLAHWQSYTRSWLLSLHLDRYFY